MLGNDKNTPHLFHDAVNQRGRWSKYAELSGLTVAVVGALVVFGWLLDVEFLKRLLPGTASMKFNTALCFAMLGFTLYRYRDEAGKHRAIDYLDILPLIVLAIGLASLAEIFFNLDLGIDELIITDRGPDIMTAPGRMSLGTSISFIVLATALPLINHCSEKPVPAIQLLILLVTISSGSVFLGYTYGVHVFQVPLFSSMALHTAMLFVILGVGILCYRPDEGLMRDITSPLIGGRMARIGLPVVILLPVLLGWLSLAGLSAGFYSVEYGFAVKTLSNIIIMIVLIWIGAGILNLEEQRFSTIVESAPTSMVMINNQGNIQLVNKLTEKLFGYERHEIIGRKIEALLPERFRKNHPSLREEFSKNPIPRAMGTGRDLYGLHKNGSEILVEVALNPIRNKDGLSVIAAITDITARKRAEIELARSNRDLEHFAYVASHDLQEPLRAVSGCVQMLQRKYAAKLGDDADQLIDHAIDGTQRMQSLIEDLLTYSRVKRIEEDFEQTDLNAVLATALKNLETAIAESHADVDSDELPTLEAIPSQFILLFQNLVGNAIKFRHQDRQLKIRIKYKATENAHLFSVIDNGIGIDSQYFERVFVIFQRLHTRDEYTGTGIGLALCKRIIDQYHGEIWVASSSAEGTTISFTLPFGITFKTDDPPDRSENERT